MTLDQGIGRREFLGQAALSAGVLAGVDGRSKSVWADDQSSPSTDEWFFAIQTHAHDYFLEGAQTAAGRMAERGGFNVMLFAATYVRESKWTGHQSGNPYVVESGVVTARAQSTGVLISCTRLQHLRPAISSALGFTSSTS